jgi:flagellar protein FlbD
MIQLTAFSGRELVINALLVERIEAVPDTVITLTTGKTYVVKESVDEVVSRSVEYLRSLRGDENVGSPALLAQLGRVVK